MATVRTTKKGKTISKQKKKLSDKQKLVQLSVQQRQKVQEQAFEWQEQLFSQSSVPIDILQQAALWLQPQTYDEVIEERNVQSFCGYPLCSKQPNIQSKYKISLSQRKVFDQSELSNYCSTSCLQKSKYYTMQLSEDPVWIRDFHSFIPSTVRVISMDENFSKVINEQQNKHKKGLSDQDLKKGYVKKLLSNVPIGNNNHHTPTTITETSVSDINNQFNINIIENTTDDNIELPVLGIHDAIEGFRIDTSKKNKKEPTTIVLNPTTTTTTVTITDTNNDDHDVDPEFLLDEAMETMKMLKSLELEEHVKNNTKEIVEENDDDNDDNNDTEDHNDKSLYLIEKDLNENIQNNNNTNGNKDDDNDNDNEHTNQSNKKSSHPEKSSSTMLNTVSVNDTISTTTTDSSSLKTNQSTSNVIEIKTKTPKNASTNPKQSKKKKKEPEMSLFGKIWTLVDRLTTKTTRQFLASLKNGGDLTLLLNESDINNADLLRGQIFSEKVLEMYGVIRSQMGIREEIELDIVNLIRTFHFAEASMVVLEPDQTYMFTLVLFKALAPDLLKDDWNQSFESCCEYIGQSSDMIDACVRVLKVAST
ncbi:unnamed protein product [Cunninghamella blakesleeana]